MPESAQALDPRTLPRGRARAHSALVRVMRIVLPATMLLVVAVLAGLVSQHAIRRHDAARRDATTPIRMLNPHFFGRDNNGRPYTLTARQAARDEQSFQVVLLNHPSLTLDIDSPTPSSIVADSGVYHEDSRLLQLRGHIRGSGAKASHVATDEATIDTRTGAVMGPGGFAGQTSVGSVKSNGFAAYDKGDRVVFKGGVHSRLNSQ